MTRSPSTLRNALTVLVTYAGTAGFTAVLTVYLVRALGPTAFGIFSLALGIAGLMALALDFGIAASLSRFLAERREDPREQASLFAGALRLKLALGIVATALLAGLADPIAEAYDEPALVWPIRALALATLLQSVMGQIGGAWFAIGRPATNLRMVVAESAAEMTASVALVVIAGGAAAAGWGRAAGYAVGVVVGMVLVRRVFGRGALAVHRRGGQRMATMGRYALWLWLVNGAYTVFGQLDVLAIGAILDSTAVGAFSAPMRLTLLLGYPALAIANTVAPRLARGPDGTIPSPGALQVALRWSILIHAAMLPVLIVWAQPIVTLVLGDDYDDSVEVLRVIAPFVFLQGLATLLSLAANYLGEGRARLPWTVAAVVVNLAIDIVLLESMGIVAAAIGTSVAFALYVVGHLLICARSLPIASGALTLTILRALAAAAAMAGVLALFGSGELSPLQWIAGLTLGTAVYGAALVALGEVTRAELGAVGARLRSIR